MIVFPENWIEYEFGKFAEFNSKIDLKKGINYPFVPMEELNAHRKYVTASGTKEYAGGGAKFCNGDTLFARITPCLENGKIAQVKNLAGGKGFGSTEYFVFRGRENISNSDFIYYLSKTDWFQQNAINSMVGASGRQRADAGFVSKTPLILPPLLTQNKIAVILSAYDDLIENNLKRIKLLEEMAQITYEEWFVRMKFPGHETTPIDSETGLPGGWGRQKLGELLVLNYGKSLTADNRAEGDIPVYGSAGVVGNHTESLVDGPGVIVGRKGNVGSVFWTNTSFYPIDTVFYVTSAFPLQFLYFLLNSIEFVNNDAAVPGLNRNAAYMVKVTIPNIDLITKFSRYTDQLFQCIENLNHQNKLLKEARDILLPRLMTGMIDVEQLALPEPFNQPILAQESHAA